VATLSLLPTTTIRYFSLIKLTVGTEGVAEMAGDSKEDTKQPA
jgi:hypothetical protein